MTFQGEQTLLILGASGDLAARLLVPGLGSLIANGAVEGVSLVGSAADDWNDERWRSRVAESFAGAGATGERIDAVADSTRYIKADVTAGSEWRRMLNACDGSLVIYFALPPAITERACQALIGIDLPPGTRLVFEKPFGTDAASARALNQLVTRIVPEERVFRVDHFLGTSTVMNIAGLRFANRIFEPLMSAEHVERVDIVFDESLGLEGRAGYYEGTGALIDMIQSHLLQVMSVLAMDPPSTIGERDVRDAKAAILRACTVRDGDPVANSFRARYTAGEVDGRRLSSYTDEDGIPGESTTETLAEVVLEIDTWRWAGVPFRLRSGKALGHPRQEVVVTFKRAPHIPKGLTGGDHPGRLHIGIALDAGRVTLGLNVNGPGDPREINPVTIDTGMAPGELHEYGEVLRGIFGGDPILSVRGDMAVEAWRIIEPVLEAWRDDRVPLEEYPAGSTGPDGWPLSGVSPAPAAVATPQRVAADRDDG
jgi:glucose-6-phosphate 1-dehydrogenase